MEKLKSRILTYLQEGQCFEPELAIEVADNLIDVVFEWITDAADYMHGSSEVLGELREEI